MSTGPFAPPPGAYPPVPQAPTPPSRGSSALKFLGVGCAVMLAGGICAGAVAYRFAAKALSGGNEIAAQPFTSGAPFQFELRSSGRDLKVWLDLDAQHTDGLPLQGSIAVATNGTPQRQATLRGNLGAGCANPTEGERSSLCLRWISSEVNGQGRVSGRTRLFTLPASPPGAVVTLGGTVFTGTGTTLRSARIVVTD